MKRSRHILSVVVIVITCMTLQSLTAPQRASSGKRRSRGPVLKKGDKAPSFSLLMLSEGAKDKPKQVSLSEAIKGRPVALVFSSFT